VLAPSLLEYTFSAVPAKVISVVVVAPETGVHVVGPVFCSSCQVMVTGPE
jgi:hypothetical protein